MDIINGLANILEELRKMQRIYKEMRRSELEEKQTKKF
jgi:hypothetical protein